MKSFFTICLIILGLPLAILPQATPVTTAGQVINAVMGDTSVPVPVTVTGFNNIGQFTLTMKFDTTRVRYVSSTTNPALQGMTVTYTHPSGNTQGKLVFTWTGASNVSLPDGSEIAGLVFHYITGTGNLNWSYTFGAVCQYKRYIGSTLSLLADLPKYQYYCNGGISNRSAPYTYAPAIASPVPGTIQVPLIVNGFATIGGLTLYLEYDPDIITYSNIFTKNAAFGSAFQVGEITTEDGRRVIVMQWFGNSVTLADGSTLCTLNFTYPQANCNPGILNWFDNGPSCEYSDAQANVLIDMPQQTYYFNGVVASGLPNTWTGNAGYAWNDAGNWNECGVPDLSKQVIIPDVAPQPYPVLTTAASCKSLLIRSGAVLTIATTGSITVGDD